MKKNKNKLILIGILVILFFINKLIGHFTSINQDSSSASLDILKKAISDLQIMYQSNNYIFLTIFSFTFIIIIILYIPFIATFFCMAAGFILPFFFGLVYFSLLVGLAYTSSFLISKYFFQQKIQKSMGKKGKSIQKAFEENGAMYLLSLRLSGVTPGSLLNAVMSITNISPWKFYLATQIGILPHAITTYYMGSQLTHINDFQSFIPDKVFIAIFISSLLPLILQSIVENFYNKK